MPNIFNSIKYEDNGKGNRYQPDVPSANSNEMKEILDELPLEIIRQLNDNLSKMSNAISNYITSITVEAAEGGMLSSKYCNYSAVATITGTATITYDEKAILRKVARNETLTYRNGNWYASSGRAVALSDYGISVSGTLENGNAISIVVYVNADNPVSTALIATEASTLGGYSANDFIRVDTTEEHEQHTHSVASIKEIQMTLSSGSWIDGSADGCAYKLTVSNGDILASDNPIVSPVYSTNITTARNQKKSWAMIDTAVTNNGSIVFKCLDKKPTESIQVTLQLVRPYSFITID